MNKSLLCWIGIHKWIFRLPDWGGERGGETLKEDNTLREHHCPTCKCSWLQEGVIRICARGCGARNIYRDSYWRSFK